MNILINDILTPQKLDNARKFVLEKLFVSKESFKTCFPSSASVDNVYAEVKNEAGWTQGFWTGILWLGYELSGNEAFREIAEINLSSFHNRITKQLGVDHHDMGFLYIPSCVASYKLTGNSAAKRAALLAADTLMRRYRQKGEFLQAWGDMDLADNYRLIIDCMLNIPLLYWASQVSGNKEYDEVAFKHFNSTADNIMRADGSTYHTFYFDPETGRPVMGVTSQGASDDSCWSRGQAWGMYGMLLTYIYHPEQKAIDKFKCITDYFLSHLPADDVPYWDMIFTDGSDEPRDSSSAAIAVCALLESMKHLPDSDPSKDKYLIYANKIMSSLIDNYLCYDVPGCNGLLLHATYTKPRGIGVDECNIWGDYFFMEALIRFVTNNKWNLYW